MGDKSLYEFTGSGWGLWFSTRKWMLYKLGTQENLATDIKPIWGILETRSALSKLWIAFFLIERHHPVWIAWCWNYEIKIFENNFRGMVLFFENPTSNPSNYSTAAMRCSEMRQVLQTWTGERWDWILSKMTYQSSLENQGPLENLWTSSQRC